MSLLFMLLVFMLLIYTLLVLNIPPVHAVGFDCSEQAKGHCGFESSRHDLESSKHVSWDATKVVKCSEITLLGSAVGLRVVPSYF